MTIVDSGFLRVQVDDYQVCYLSLSRWVILSSAAVMRSDACDTQSPSVHFKLIIKTCMERWTTFLIWKSSARGAQECCLSWSAPAVWPTCVWCREGAPVSLVDFVQTALAHDCILIKKASRHWDSWVLAGQISVLELKMGLDTSLPRNLWKVGFRVRAFSLEINSLADYLTCPARPICKFPSLCCPWSATFSFIGFPSLVFIYLANIYWVSISDECSSVRKQAVSALWSLHSGKADRRH